MSLRTGIFLLATMFFGCFGNPAETFTNPTAPLTEENQFSEAVGDSADSENLRNDALEITESWIVKNNHYEEFGLMENDVVTKINNIELSKTIPTELVAMLGEDTNLKIEIQRGSEHIALNEILNLEVSLSDGGIVITPYSTCAPKECAGGASPCEKCAPNFGLQCCDVCADGGCFVGTCGIRPNTYPCCLNTSLCNF
jgi:hypothetical protein